MFMEATPDKHDRDSARGLFASGTQALTGSQQRHLAAIVAHANDAIISHTLEGSILSWNPAAERAYGFTAQEMLGRSLAHLVPAQHPNPMASVLAKIRIGQTVEHIETVWQHKNGTPVDVAISVAPIKNENGVIVGAATVAREIALEKRLRSALQQERVFFESAFEALQDIFFAVDLQGRLIRWNDQLRNISGYCDDELSQMWAWNFFTESNIPRVQRAISEALLSGHAHLQAEGMTKAGQPIPFELVGSVLTDPQGQPYAICGIARDITDRKKAEETLRLTQFAIDHCSDAAYWMEPDGHIFYVNDEACRILEYSREELLKMTVYDIDPNFQPDTWTDHWQVITHSRRLRLESIHLTKSGRRIPVDISANYVRFGEKEYNCSFARDLSEKKQVERKAREYEMRLSMSQRMEALGTLAGGIAHDFNNILSSILGFSELALDTIDHETVLYDNVREIFTAGMRARDLVRQILTFSRQAEHEKQPVQFKIIVKEALKLLRASIPTTIAIRANIVSDALVLADPSQLHQIVMNLCTNAAHALQPEGGTMEVALTDVDLDADYAATHPDIEPGRYMQLTVTDTGKGIPKEIIGRIFDPFFTTKKQGEGTGLGLSMVHGIVHDHGGHVSVVSQEGGGAAFTVHLPLLQRTKRAARLESECLPSGKEHILLVDDEAAVVKMSTQMLQRLQYQVTSRTSSIEALALFNEKSSQFDLVITDFTMPNLTGPKLAAELIKIRPTIPIILCTGFSGEISDEKAAKLGIKAIIMKPIAKSELATTVREVLDKAKAGTPAAA